VQFIVILLMSMWWFGWSGTVFLSSTRVIFAAALDRMLPEWVTTIEPRSRTPIAALLLMVIPGLIVGLPVCLQPPQLPDPGAGLDPGDCRDLLWLNHRSHHPALAPEGDLRWLADLQDAGLQRVGLGSHGSSLAVGSSS
jgi:hypothetical protein